MTKAQATQLGNEMVAKLGDGWTFNVFENIGWHASAHSPTKHIYVSVHVDGPSGKPIYMAMMTDDPVKFLNCGNPLWTEGRPYKIYADPVTAVIDQVKYAREKVDSLLAAVEQVEKTVAEFTCPCCGKSRVK